MTNLTDIKKIAILGLFLAVGIILAIFETYIPRPLPWIKPGLANVATLTVLYLFGPREAISINSLRAVLVYLFTVGFGGPGFWIAFIASFVSAFAMFLVVRSSAPNVGPIGVSMVGAFAHIISQLTIAGLFIVGRIEIIYLLPLFVFSTFFAGLAVGLLSFLILEHLQKRFSLRYAIPSGV